MSLSCLLIILIAIIPASYFKEKYDEALFFLYLVEITPLLEIIGDGSVVPQYLPIKGPLVLYPSYN